MNKLKKQNTTIEMTQSSGNVFKDLGIAAPEEYLVKSDLAAQINHLMSARGLRQIDAAELLGVDQPKISAISRGQLTGFSLERLIHYLNQLDQDVKIVVKPKPLKRPDHGHFQVAFG